MLFRLPPLPLQEPEIVQLQETSNPDFVLNTPLSEDIPPLRDPFSKSTALPSISKSTLKDPYGLRLKAVIFSVKNGVVIEDSRQGEVYFLSEGENVKGIQLQNMTKSAVTLNVDGKQIILPLAGEKP
ncbi:MAG: hypothetical protein WCI27_00310 [Candidatus Omnitrophota bacterium]